MRRGAGASKERPQEAGSESEACKPWYKVPVLANSRFDVRKRNASLAGCEQAALLSPCAPNAALAGTICCNLVGWLLTVTCDLSPSRSSAGAGCGRKHKLHVSVARTTANHGFFGDNTRTACYVRVANKMKNDYLCSIAAS